MFFNDGPSKDEAQQVLRDVLAFVTPDSADVVRIVAQGLKTDQLTYEAVFLEWVKPFGRVKARKLWSLAKPDPDVFHDLIEMRFEAAERPRVAVPEPAGLLGRDADLAHLGTALAEAGRGGGHLP